MRIGMIIGDINPGRLGGAEVHVVEVMKRLAEGGYEIHAFIGDNREIANSFESNNIQFYSINYPKIPNLRYLLFILSAVRRISQLLRKQPVDILHATLEFPQSVVGARLSKKFGIPLVTTVQNPLSYIEEVFVHSPIRLPNRITTVIQSTLKPLVEYGLRNSTVVLPTSNYSLTNCIKMGAKRCILIPNGVDTDVFYPKVTALRKSNKIHLVTTSSLIPRNGLDTLIKALAYVSGEIDSIKLTIAGDGPLELELKKLAEKLDIRNKIVFMGRIPHEEVPKLLQSADIFIRPSIAEGFGVSFIEAMASNVPVITCPSGGIVDFIENYKTGILVPANEPMALKDAILELIENEELYQNIQGNALRLVKEEYSWDVIAAKISKIYGECSVLSN